MLIQLEIENLAVIEKAAVRFTGGLNVFTGETGAGKSLLISGIGAVTGQRVSKDSVRFGEKSAFVTALFRLNDNAAKLLSEFGIDGEDGTVVLSREIFADGGSSAKINGKPATAADLRLLSAELLDIHGQHESITLQSRDKQREILDAFAGIAPLLESYRTEFKRFSDLSRSINRLTKEAEQRDREIASLQNKLDETEPLGFVEGEAEVLEEKITRYSATESLTEQLTTALDFISGNDDAVGAYASLEKAALLLPDNLAQRLNALLAELGDIRAEVVKATPPSLEPGELESLRERFGDVRRLERVYALPLDELVSQIKVWRNRLNTLINADDTIAELTENKKLSGAKVKEFCADISEKRRAAALLFEKRIAEELAFLDMNGAAVTFAVTEDKVTVNGMDGVETLLAANKGEEPKPLAKAASGGELARVMLAVKSVLAECDSLPTLVFDEVDAGLSGKAAAKVGMKLSQLGRARQVLCVTHSAQIAANADTHFLIKKESNEERTFTSVNELSDDERFKEIARIMSGNEESLLSLQNAEELVLEARKRK
ncbi:MAG: DNA repair protein RecN [Oscillospiraceae bacterium]|jgi:DNA repair protein RecN (Recombination protein N)|nr:DNA repair protein RecN [Oscillospiraceae bacterium]